MIRIQKYLVVVFLCLWSVMAMGQEADFEIRNFRENLTVIRAEHKDLNGNPTALIRFTVRDSQFEFDANLGIIAQERKTGEISLYVPYETKRVTVRHPRLGVIRDYQIPMKLSPKVTYDADIVITGSGQVVIPEVSELDSSISQPVAPVVNQVSPQPNTTNESKAPSDFHVYAGIGFNAISVMGPSVHLGFSYKMFCLEGGFVYGLDKVENITFTLHGSSTPTEAYDYSCSKAWARLGVNIGMEKFRISPQAGVTFNMIKGKSLLTSGTDYFKDSNPMSLFAAVRLSYEVVNHLRIHVTPQYDFSLGGDQIFEVIKQADSKLKAWGEGFGINAGIIYEF